MITVVTTSMMSRHYFLGGLDSQLSSTLQHLTFATSLAFHPQAVIESSFVHLSGQYPVPSLLFHAFYPVLASFS